MEAATYTRTKNATTSFRIKDLMVGELLCQAAIVSDSQLLHFVALARTAGASLGSALVFSKLLTASELFIARRLVNRYLNDSDNPEKYIKELSKIVAKNPRHQTRPSSISLAKITRRHLQVNQPLFLVS